MQEQSKLISIIEPIFRRHGYFVYRYGTGGVVVHMKKLSVRGDDAGTHGSYGAVAHYSCGSDDESYVIHKHETDPSRFETFRDSIDDVKEHLGFIIARTSEGKRRMGKENHEKAQSEQSSVAIKVLVILAAIVIFALIVGS